MLTSMIDDYVKKNPGEEQSAETKAIQDKHDCFK